MGSIRNYQQLEVWKKSIELVTAVYTLTNDFPSEEKFSLTSQIRRCAVSIPSNIAEGKLRGTDKELKRFLLISFGSGGELETQIVIAKELAMTKKLNYTSVDMLLEEVMKMLNSLIGKLDASS